MIDEIKEMKKSHIRMSTVLNELEFLEDGEGADYSEAVTDYKWLVQMLEHRRETLLRRGRTI